MRAILVAPFPPPINGNTVASEVVAIGLGAMDWKIERVDLSSRGTRASGTFSLLRVREILRSVRELRRLLKLAMVDVVYITVAQSYWGMTRDVLLVREAQARGIPVVTHLHGGNLGNTLAKLPRWARTLYRRYLGRVEAGIVLDDGLRDQWAGILPEQRVIVVPNGVDKSLIMAGARRGCFPTSFTGTEPLRVLWLSNLIPTKGIGEVLDAAERTHKEGLPVVFTIAGAVIDESMKTRVEELAARGVVRYLGLISGEVKQETLLSHHVFVLPSYYPPEGQPIALLEGMATGLVPIVTRYRGMQGLVRHGHNGLYVAPQSGSAVYQAITEVLGAAPRLSDMSRSSHETVKFFDNDRYVKAVSDVLEKSIRQDLAY